MTQASAQLTVFADIASRAAALLVDLVLLVIAAAAVAAELPGPYVFPALALLYFVGMPRSPLQGTLGKWIFRIRICDRLGKRLTWRASALRGGAMMAWFGLPILIREFSLFMGLQEASLSAIWWLLIAVPWAPAGFLPRRESLFDLLAGSLVVRYRADAESIARAEPAQRPGILNVAGTAILSLGAGAALSVVMTTQNDMNRRARVAYAIAQTEPLRQKVEAFHDREQRWPKAGELGVPEWTPYRDGGGYRLEEDGSIVITFAVLPELKGRSITFRPSRAADGKKLQWQCSTDAGLNPGYVPARCRQ